MTTNSAVIGFPIQAMFRTFTSAKSLVSSGSTVGKIIGGAITGGALAVSAMQVANAIRPSLSAYLEKESNQTAFAMGSTSVNPLEALITFMDLQASRLKISEKVRLARIDVIGREGDYLQTTGSKSVDYHIEGRFFAVDIAGRPQSPFSEIFKASLGNVAVGNTQLLRMLERTKIPVPFMSEYDIAEVLIVNTEFNAYGGRPYFIEYAIDLVEYRRLPSLIKMLSLAGLGAL